MTSARVQLLPMPGKETGQATEGAGVHGVCDVPPPGHVVVTVAV